MEWVRAHYLDASALVKLVVDEHDSQAVRTFFQENMNFHTTSLCLGEALGVLKSKWTHGKISTEGYYAATRRLIRDVGGKRIALDNVELLDLFMHPQVEAMAKKHGLDLSDALQLVTILKGRYSALGPNSASALITADGGLAKAAETENIRVWNCSAGPVPVWP